MVLYLLNLTVLHHASQAAADQRGGKNSGSLSSLHRQQAQPSVPMAPEVISKPPTSLVPMESEMQSGTAQPQDNNLINLLRWVCSSNHGYTWGYVSHFSLLYRYQSDKEVFNSLPLMVALEVFLLISFCSYSYL